MNSSTVAILNEDYIVRGDAQINYIEQVARLVDSRMRELQRNAPDLNAKRLAVLTAINLADELLQEKKESKGDFEKRQSTLEESTVRRTSELISLLDEGLTACSNLS